MRKEWKNAAKVSLKKHYWILVVVCLFASFFGIEYGTSFSAEHAQMPESNKETIFTDLVTDNEEAAEETVAESEAAIKEHDTNAYLGRSRGVFSMLLNSYSSGSFIVAVSDAVRNITGSGNLYIALMILGGLAVYCFIWLFVKETYLIIMRRIVLECRTYKKVMLSRFLYPVQTKKWPHMAWVMGVKSLYQYLWSITIIGGFVKQYSYRMVPYIMAENPSLGANEAITLSRKMMDGHKWECFVADLSFWGWEILNIVTLGLSGIFYSNPYKAAFFGEYYEYLRRLAKKDQIPGAEMLNDKFLFQKPAEETVAAAYPDLAELVNSEAEEVQAPKGFFGMLSRIFGIVVIKSDEILAYEKKKAKQYKKEQGRKLLHGETYPGRLAPVPMDSRKTTASNLLPTKSYTLLNLVMMFFIFSMIGWIWEVSLHLISDGVFVNRGVLHGPWLPIYGTGGILILIVLKSLREKPAVEFIAAVILCGCVEYFTAWNLEMTHNGQKWWDYSGYFLNLHGRICAEGLLVFGLGGLAIVYLLAPFLDNLLQKINRKVLLAVALILLVIYVGDQAYSSKHPNTGEGITSVYNEQQTNTENQMINI